MNMEAWKQLVAFPVYEVSDAGRVRRIWKKGPVLLSPCVQNNGYMKITLRRNSAEQKTALVHRLVAAAFIGEAGAGMQVNHKNGDKTDNRLANLEYITPAGNHAHGVEVLGHAPLHPGTGSGHHQAKLREADVLEIRRLYACGAHPKDIAKRFHIVRTSVYPIVNRKTWRHI